MFHEQILIVSTLNSHSMSITVLLHTFGTDDEYQCRNFYVVFVKIRSYVVFCP